MQRLLAELRSLKISLLLQKGFYLLCSPMHFPLTARWCRYDVSTHYGHKFQAPQNFFRDIVTQWDFELFSSSNNYRTRAIITRSRFETALDYKPRIFRLRKVSMQYKPLCSINRGLYYNESFLSLTIFQFLIVLQT